MPVWVRLASGGLVVVATLSPVLVYAKHGFPERFPYAMLTQDQLNSERSRYWSGVGTTDTSFDDRDKPKNVLLIGNSHAYDLSYALTENGFSGHIKLIGTGGECYNFGHDPIQPKDTELCKAKLAKVMDSPDLPKAGVIYLHDSWGGLDLNKLSAMIELIRQRSQAPIYVIGPKMLFSESVLSISKEAQEGRFTTTDAINEYSRRYAHTTLKQFDHTLEVFFSGHRFPEVRYVSALDAQCGPELKCDILSAGGQYLYFDNNHFTLEGAREFGQRLKRQDGFLFGDNPKG